MKSSSRRLIIALALLLSPLMRAESNQDVIVYSYTTAAGKKIVPPTTAAPAYYLLVDGGYREEGDPVAGEVKPDPVRVEKLVRRALTQQHYVGVSAKSPHLDFIMVYHWGYLAPGDKEFESTRDRAKRISLVGGKQLAEMMPQEFGREELMQAAGEDRYFVVISAFDYKSYVEKKQRTLLWRAQISGSSNGTTLDEVLPAFLATGAPLFGKDSGIPSEKVVRLAPVGTVEVGTPTVEEYLPAVTLPAPPTKAEQDKKAKKP